VVIFVAWAMLVSAVAYQDQVEDQLLQDQELILSIERSIKSVEATNTKIFKTIEVD